MTKVCKHYVKKSCSKGDKCDFEHIDNICPHYFFGNCKNGDGCKLSHQHKLNNKKKLIKKNTESFIPSHKMADMRVVVGSNTHTYNNVIQTRDVILVNNLFCDELSLDIYNKLLEEIKDSGLNEDKLWKLWHGDSHMIADDHLAWKSKCPTFTNIIDKIKTYFNMDIKATRFNWYRDSSDWKPNHHDAAAIDSNKAKTQNFTVGVSFGATREAIFEHATTKTTVSIPLVNGSVYCFSKDTNIEWRHGIPQLPPALQHKNGRISIIAWGWVHQN
jgi:hypothetical protein